MSRSNFSAENYKIILKIEPSGTSVLPYVLGIILGLILIILTISLDIKFNTLYYYLVLMVVLFYLIIDYGYLQRNKIKLIELHEKSLNIFKGKKMIKENIQFSKIIKITTHKRIFNQKITFFLDTPARKKTNSYSISGDHIRNTDLLKLYDEIKRLISNS